MFASTANFMHGAIAAILMIRFPQIDKPGHIP
jgi:hypothetical protein